MRAVRARGLRTFIVLALAALLSPLASAGPPPLLAAEVLASVRAQYPPYLIALIERDVAAGRLRQARGAFDTNFMARGTFHPSGFYDGNTGDFVFDQPLSFWGGNVFAGYKISSAVLADYDKDRTQTDGEIRAGIRLNLLRDGKIDRRRAELWKARIDRELADPFIQRQYLEITRTAVRAYYNWVAQGLRYRIAEELLGVARERDAAIAEQAAKGAVAPIVKTDNERLVVSRQLGVVQARRRFEAASIELSLFHRDADDEPTRSGRERLPPTFPGTAVPDEAAVGRAINVAFTLRPELRRIRLVQDKAFIDQRLARNDQFPHLDFMAGVIENLGSKPYKDREATEVELGVEFRVPIQRNEAKGRLQAVEAEIERLKIDEQFTRDRVVAEIRDAWSAITAAYEQIGQTRRNVELAETLEKAEAARFKQGAADLFALQIRELATFEARQLEVDARADFFRARADYDAATAVGVAQAGAAR
jgi:outer membrane protein TolC